MTSKTRLLSIFLVSGFFLSLDRLFKYQSLHDWSVIHLLHRFLGWQPSLNAGLAFSLPMPAIITIILTIPIIAVMAYLFYKNIHHFPLNLALILIVFGALSNLFDRLIYRHTVDYFLVLTAILNIADLMITAGFILYLLSIKKPKQLQ
jgi:lipoprotein signal peptidase